MAREKSPAFQFYTKDWDSDINVIPMTYEEEGVYFAIIRLLWNHRRVTANLDELRLLLKRKPSLAQMKRWWHRIGKCFTVRDGVLVQKRVEKERRKQAAYRKSQSEKGKKGGRPKATEKPELSSGKPLLSSSSSAFSTPDQERRDPPTPAVAGASPSAVVEVFRGKDITRKERAEAEGVIAEFGCPHAHPEGDPPVPECATHDECVGRWVGEKRARERGGLKAVAS